MKRVLFVATVVKKHIMEFHIPYLKMFKESGWETYVAAKNDYENPDDCRIPYCDYYFDIPFERFPLKFNNIRSCHLLKRIVDGNQFDIIHCHTPVGAMITRFAGVSARKRGTSIIYTAHGFHFFKGAPFLNWLVYFPVEWLCSFMTDMLITINKEDFVFAQKHLHAKNIKYVPGVGIDFSKFNIHHINAKEIREKFGIPDDKIWVLSVGELIPRKNHKRLIQAIADIPQIYLTIAGEGVYKEELESVIHHLSIGDRVRLLGYRTDIPELCEAADFFAFPSLQEGLPVALMEAMACGKAVVCGRIRGNTDLIDSQGGILFDPKDIEDIKNALLTISCQDRQRMGVHNAQMVKKFDIVRIMKQMKRIYGLEK